MVPSSAPSLTLAFLAGLMSFLSPCVLPLLPSYLGVVGRGRASLLRAAGFVLGFGLVFIILGATASSLGALLAPHKLLLGRLAGFLIVFFGLVMLGVVRLPALMRDTRVMHQAHPYGSVALGAAFAFGWSPCLGPALGSILGLAASSSSLSQGVTLLACYTLGLAVPFLLAALLWDRLSLNRLGRYTGLFEKLGGTLLVIAGLLMVTGYFQVLAGWLSRVMPEWTQI
ncbi:cytochrome c biogenesis CcdA family protein [Deinococcus lacus]|uniref:Cytochrome c biogenesis CcdA family protein n=1 Tax=Deinococcus lacus TaxID=392561 RepID=A0ABW1Y9E6_9DEIO